MTFKGYEIVLNSYHWGYEAVAIPDTGEWIRRKFIGYSRWEMLDIMKDLIRGQE